MKRRMTALFLIFLLLATNLISSAHPSGDEEIEISEQEYTYQEEKRKASDLEVIALKERKKKTIQLKQVLLVEEEKYVLEKEFKVKTNQIDLAELINEDDAFKSLDSIPSGTIKYLGYRDNKGNLQEQIGKISIDVLEKNEEDFYLVLEYLLIREESMQEIEEGLAEAKHEIQEEAKDDLQVEGKEQVEIEKRLVDSEERRVEGVEQEEIKHIYVQEEQALYEIILPAASSKMEISSVEPLSIGGSKNVKVKPINSSGSWAFYHVWDTTKDPLSGVTSTLVYFELDDGSIGFCMHPGRESPEGDLSIDIFANSEFRNFAEKVATIAISSGGIPGYSFEENYVFAQMYIWKNIPYSGGSDSRYVLDFRYQHSPYEQHVETTARYLAWKEEVDSKIRSIGKISFDGDSLELDIGKEYRIKDKNNQLHSFNIKSSHEGLEIKKEDNSLILKASKPLQTKLEFWQARGDYPLPEMTFVLKGPDNTYQDLGVFRDPFVATVNISAKQSFGKIKIIKKSEENKIIPGAVFEISGSIDYREILEEVTTGKDGSIFSKEYDTAKYPKLYLREKSVPHPYKKKDEIKEIELEASKTVDVTFTNQLKSGRLSIIKKEESGEKIQGAIFELSADKDFKNIIERLTTLDDGTALSSDMSIIDNPVIYLREVSVPEPYIRSDEVMEVNLEAGMTIERVYTNDIKRLSLSKTDIVTGQAVVGAVIELMDESGNRTEYTTDSNGRVEIIGLNSGTYVFREILSPYGYVLNTESFTFSINEKGEISGVTDFTDEPTRLKILKTDVSGNPLKGAGFSVVFSGGEKDGERVMAHFDDKHGRYCANAQGSEEVFYSDVNGQVIVDYLPQGNFIVKEIEAPSGYKLGTDGFSVERNFSIDKNGLVSSEELHFVNAPTEVLLIKTDLVTGEAVPGARIEITGEDGTTESFITNDDGVVKIVGLKSGSYQFKEILAPKGYILNENSFTFILDEAGNVSGITEFTDEPTRLRIMKKDKNTGEVLAGAGFEVYFVGGERDGEVITALYDEENNRYIASEGGESLLFSDKNGEVCLDYLPQGEYIVVEKKAVPGYTLAKESSEKSKTIIIDDASTQDTNALIFLNEPTKVVLIKKDMLTGKPLPGAQIELIYESKRQSFTTDEKGQIELIGLKPGNYTFKEKKQPSGYIIEKESFAFFLDEKGERSGVSEFTNEPTMLVLRKSDEKDKAMEGVEFELINSNGKSVSADFDKKSGIYQASDQGVEKKFITGEDGMIRLDYLPEGDYILREIRAKEGYSPIKDKKVQFKNHGINSPLVLDIVNKRELPKTGQRNNRLFLYMAATFMLLGFYNKRRRLIK